MPAVRAKRARTGIYGGISAEQRQADRRRRLMDAALDLIGTQGWSNTTMRGVCERARVGPRFFYESFDDLEQLALAVLDEVIEDAIARVLAAIADEPDLEKKTRTSLDVMIREVTDDPRRARFLFSEAHGNQALMKRRSALIRSIAQVIVEQARPYLDLPPGSEQTTRAAALVLTGGVAETTLAWIDGELDLTRDQLVDLCAELLLTTGRNAPAIATRLASAPPAQTSSAATKQRAR